MQHYCFTLVRNQAPDLYLMALCAPVESRSSLIALYAFVAEIRNIRHVVREVMLGRIRFAWWREALEEIYAGQPARNHPILEELAVIIPKYQLAQTEFEKILAAENERMEAASSFLLPEEGYNALFFLSEQIIGQENRKWPKKAAMIQQHYASRVTSGRRLRKSPWLTLKLLFS